MHYDQAEVKIHMFLRYCCFIPLIATILAGCSSQPANDPIVSTVTTRTFGQRQVDQLLEDRPDMKDAIPSSHSAVIWLIDGFDGKRLGQRIYWNANSPQSGRPAEHLPAYGAYPPAISISGGAETTPIDKWVMVIFEMHNLENGQFEAIVSRAMAGELDSDSFAHKCLEQEFVALQKTRDFLRENPLTTSRQPRNRYYEWIMANSGTYEDFKKSFESPMATSSNSNLKYFKEYYDTSIKPYRDWMSK